MKPNIESIKTTEAKDKAQFDENLKNNNCLQKLKKYVVESNYPELTLIVCVLLSFYEKGRNFMPKHEIVETTYNFIKNYKNDVFIIRFNKTKYKEKILLKNFNKRVSVLLERKTFINKIEKSKGDTYYSLDLKLFEEKFDLIFNELKELPNKKSKEDDESEAGEINNNNPKIFEIKEVDSDDSEKKKKININDEIRKSLLKINKERKTDLKFLSKKRASESRNIIEIKNHIKKKNMFNTNKSVTKYILPNTNINSNNNNKDNLSKIIKNNMKNNNNINNKVNNNIKNNNNILNGNRSNSLNINKNFNIKKTNNNPIAYFLENKKNNNNNNINKIISICGNSNNNAINNNNYNNNFIDKNLNSNNEINYDLLMNLLSNNCNNLILLINEIRKNPEAQSKISDDTKYRIINEINDLKMEINIKNKIIEEKMKQLSLLKDKEDLYFSHKKETIKDLPNELKHLFEEYINNIQILKYYKEIIKLSKDNNKKLFIGKYKETYDQCVSLSENISIKLSLVTYEFIYSENFMEYLNKNISNKNNSLITHIKNYKNSFNYITYNTFEKLKESLKSKLNEIKSDSFFKEYIIEKENLIKKTPENEKEKINDDFKVEVKESIKLSNNEKLPEEVLKVIKNNKINSENREAKSIDKKMEESSKVISDIEETDNKGSEKEEKFEPNIIKIETTDNFDL